MAGNLSSQQLCTALWIFVRHVPLLQQQLPPSPLAPLLPPLIERMFALVVDVSSVTSEALCDLLHVVTRWRGSAVTLLPRIGQQVEARLERGQLRLPHIVEVAWALHELSAGSPLPLLKTVVIEITRKARVDATDQLVEAMRAVSCLPMQRPWPVLEAVVRELKTKALDPKMLVDLTDSCVPPA